MKKVIVSTFLLAGLAANATKITKIGTFEGSVSNGQVHGKCLSSSKTCWEYDTEKKTLTIHLRVLHGAEMPTVDGDGNWTATYQD